MSTENLQNNRLDNTVTRDLDFHQRRVTNAHPSIDDYDYVVRKELRRLEDALITKVSSDGKFTVLEKATFGIGIGAVQPIGNDLTPHYLIRKSGRLVDCVANAKTPPATLDINLDILRTTDEGTTWLSIFPDTAKMVIPATETGMFIQNSFNIAQIYKDEWLRIDLLAGSGEDAKDIEVVLRWEAASGVER